MARCRERGRGRRRALLLPLLVLPLIMSGEPQCRPVPVHGDRPWCGGVRCPLLPGRVVACNETAHCEYAFEEPTGRSRWDVMIWVPASSFPMGAPPGQGATNAQPVHTVTLEAGYWVDRYEVTAEAYAAFLNERGSNWCDQPGLGPVACLDSASGEGTLSWNVGEGRAEVGNDCQSSATDPFLPASCAEHPAVEVGRPGAAAFCAWAGKRLCSEAEWERAAKGTSQQPYPWGDASPGPDLVNCGPADCADGFLGSAPVGSFPAGRSPVGAEDMSGNALEWVADDWHDDYVGAPTDGSAWLADPAERAALFGTRRGGIWYGGASRVWKRDRSGRVDYATARGLRCCR